MKKILVLLLTSSCCFSAFSQEFYRYKNEQGQTVMDSTIPAQFVANGYDILDARGQLVRRVPAQQAAVPGSSAADESLQAEAQAQDQMLLSSYSSVAEIEAHRQRKLEAIEREISIIESDQRVMGGEFEQVNAEYAELVEREREIPDALAQSRNDLEATLVFLDQQLQRRLQEIQTTRQEFDARVERFQLVKSEM